MDGGAILEAVRAMIGKTEPIGSFDIDCERNKNLNNLVYVVDELVYDIVKVATMRHSKPYSVSKMGESAYKAMNDIWSFIDVYLEENDDNG